jgi:hypothetical protein
MATSSNAQVMLTGCALIVTSRNPRPMSRTEQEGSREGRSWSKESPAEVSY